MPIPENLCCLVLNQLELGMLQPVVHALAQHMTDHSRAILGALERSNRKAWKALEIALAGETLWTRLDRADVRAIRNQIRSFLDQVPVPELDEKPEYRTRWLNELREANKKGILLGSLVAGDLAEKTGRFAALSDQTSLLNAEKTALKRLGKDVQNQGYQALGWLLGQPAQSGQSVIVCAARYFFRREVETNPELFRGLQFSAVESLGESQLNGFRSLEDLLTRSADRLEQALMEATAEILSAVAETHESVKATHESVKDLEAYLKVQFAAFLTKLDMVNKPVQPEHSVSVRSESERESVRQVLDKLRSAPEKTQRVLANGAGKLQIAIGDYAAAAASFTHAAFQATTTSERAEAFHNAFRARLEEKNYDKALTDLNRAMNLEPGRFSPFPTDKYELTRILGAGGFGVTFQCKHLITGTPVAVKSLNDHNLDQDISAVLREASALDKLKHRAIIGFRDCGYADAANKQRPYLVMEYFEGETLQDYIEKRGPIPVDEATPLARTLAEALAIAHQHNVLHRDVKPANVMVKRIGSRYDVRLIDFGLAMKASVLTESMSTARGHTVFGASIAGTLDYAAPEQLGKLSGAKIGPPADVYGYAKTLCFTLFQTPEPTLKHYKSVPDYLADLIGRCLSRDPADRPQTFQQILSVFAEPTYIITEKRIQPLHTPSPALNQRKSDGITSNQRKDQVDLEAVRFPALAVITIGALSFLVSLFMGIFSIAIDKDMDGDLHKSTVDASAVETSTGSKSGMREKTKNKSDQPLSQSHTNTNTNINSESIHHTGIMAGILYFGLALPAGLAVLGGWSMLRLRLYTLSVVGSISVMIGGCMCFFLGVPVGLWALVVLMRSDVRSAFR